MSSKVIAEGPESHAMALVQVGGADMGFFGSLGHTKAAKPVGKSSLSQSKASKSEEVRKAGSQEAGTHASEDGNVEDRGRWNEQERAPQHDGQASTKAAGSETEDTEQRGRWGEAPDIDHGKAAAESGGPPEPVALPLGVIVDRGERRARESLIGTALCCAILPNIPNIVRHHMLPLMQSCS